MTANFTDTTWNVIVSSGVAFTDSKILPSLMASPVLGHSPYQYYVDSVIPPIGLGAFVKVSPSKKVLAIRFDNAGASATVADVSETLVGTSSFTVAATNSASAPAPGTYEIPVLLRIVDSLGNAASATAIVHLIIS
jgi:hypothetical protein